MFEAFGALIPAKIVKQGKKSNSGEWIGQFHVFSREKKETVSRMEGRKCGFFSCCILSFIRNSLRFWQAAFMVSISFTLGRTDCMESAGITVQDIKL